MQFLNAGKYIANVADGSVQFYGARSETLDVVPGIAPRYNSSRLYHSQPVMKTEPQWTVLLSKLASHEQDEEKRRLMLKEIDRLSEQVPPKKRPQSNNRDFRAA